jgi:AcrR family transcriptional regulator
MDQTTPTARYHHGALRAALVRAGYELAVEQGPDAVTLRAATRRVGVSPTAAYRHFAGVGELRFAVGLRSLSEMARSMEAHQAAVTESEPRPRARAMLEAVGTGYLAFALDHPRAFLVGLYGRLGMEHAELPDGAGDNGRTPFQLLTEALRGLAEVGCLPTGDVEPAAIHCWSSVHGFASLAIQGPLRDTPREVQDALAGRLVRDVVDGVLASGAAHRTAPSTQADRTAQG